MKILEWFKSLMPSFSRSSIYEDLKFARKELQETLPPLAAASEFWARRDFVDRDVKKFDTDFDKATNQHHGRFRNFIDAMAEMVQRIETNLSVVEKLVDRHFAEDVIKEGLTYTRANILRYIEVLNFALRYSRHALLWTYMKETQAVEASSKIEMTKAELLWLELNQRAFAAAFNILMIKESDLTKAIGSIPDAVVDETTYDSIKATTGVNRLDPLAMNLIGVRFNIFYRVQQYMAEWQDTRYKASIEERNVLELRLMNLKNQINGTPDPKLEARIEYEETRLQKLKAKILKYEEEVNG